MPAGSLPLLGSLPWGCIEVYLFSFCLRTNASISSLSRWLAFSLRESSSGRRQEQPGSWLPTPCSGRWAKAGDLAQGALAAGERPKSLQPQEKPGAAKLVHVQAPVWGPHMLSLHHVTPQQPPGQLALRQHCFEREGEVS